MTKFSFLNMEDSRKISTLNVDDRSRFYISKGKLIFLNDRSEKHSKYGLFLAIPSLLCSLIFLCFFIEFVGFSDIIIPISVVIAIALNIIYFTFKITNRNRKLTIDLILLITEPSVAISAFVLYISTFFGFPNKLLILIMWFLMVFAFICWISFSITGIIASIFYINYKILWEYNINVNKIILRTEILKLRKKKEFKISDLDYLKVVEKLKMDSPVYTYTHLLENVFMNGKKYIIFKTDVDFEAYDVMKQINIFLGT